MYFIFLETSFETPMDKSFTKNYLDSIEGKDSNVSMEDQEFLKMLLEDTNEISAMKDEKLSADFEEMDSEFLLNNPKADQEKYGTIKVNTFNEWARLSVLDHDKQICYNDLKLPNMRKLVNEL